MALLHSTPSLVFHVQEKLTAIGLETVEAAVQRTTLNETDRTYVDWLNTWMLTPESFPEDIQKEMWAARNLLIARAEEIAQREGKAFVMTQPDPVLFSFACPYEYTILLLLIEQPPH